MRALITGIGGQDGAYLAKELHAHGRQLFGVTTRSPSAIAVPDGGEVRVVDWHKSDEIRTLLSEWQPEEIYHLASPSCLRDELAFEDDILTVCTRGTLQILRWMADEAPHTRLFFAGSAEVYGEPVESPQSEQTPPRPDHPYAIAKLAGAQLCRSFRKSKSLFACVGILFNHESPLRRTEFVTRRISQGVARIARGQAKSLTLGNLDAVRDWCHASDFVRAFRLMMEHEKPEDFVLASGTGRTVREFCEAAFSTVNLDFRNYVTSDKRAFRRDFKNSRIGNAKKAAQELGWTPQIEFQEIVREMVQNDMMLLNTEKVI